uniref:RING-type domain-containing protein n=1 Tax=Sinocyclocheilus grahami TaxID=75366 RepID=A0A672KZ82_SINGR
MAEARISVDQNEFMCAVCLDLLKDPVTIQCGHSYCKSCITDQWDQEDQKKVYSCPQCRQIFRPRPALAKNTILAEVVEKIKTAVVRPVGCTAKFSETPLETAYGREMNIQFTGNSSGGHSCSQHANCTLPHNLRHL